MQTRTAILNICLVDLYSESKLYFSNHLLAGKPARRRAKYSADPVKAKFLRHLPEHERHVGAQKQLPARTNTGGQCPQAIEPGSSKIRGCILKTNLRHARDHVNGPGRLME